jgi:hypothetical protein
VLSTSTVLPPYVVRTSDGRCAVPDGMFSAIGAHAVTLTSRPSRAIATTAASTAAAPPMSDFIHSIAAAGLSDRPPESKVMPLPTSARLGLPRPAL